MVDAGLVTVLGFLGLNVQISYVDTVGLISLVGYSGTQSIWTSVSYQHQSAGLNLVQMKKLKRNIHRGKTTFITVYKLVA